MRKKGKRPRGRPRKILVSTTGSTSKASGGGRLTCDVEFRKTCRSLRSPAALRRDRPRPPTTLRPPAPRPPHQKTRRTRTTAR